MEGRSGKGASLRRMHTEYQIGSSRSGQQSSQRPSPTSSSRSGFWNTVMDRPGPSLTPSGGSFHATFPAAGSSSGQVQPAQSFHGSASSSARPPTAPTSSSRSSSKRYQCSDCKLHFNSAHEVAAHRQRVHPRPRRPFHCPHCPLDFTQRSHLNQHVRTVHEKIRPHKCNECEKAFGKKYDLVSHKSAVHSNQRPHACDVCERKFSKRSNLTRHKDKVHAQDRRR